jgi:hypothetical protein
MKKNLFVLALLITSASYAQDKLLLETKYFRFYSNEVLNVHLYLYKQATQIKSQRVPEDSLQLYLKKYGLFADKKTDKLILEAIKFYRDSLTTKDMLFDSTMRKFSVLLAEGNYINAEGWQTKALNYIQGLHSFFLKQVWPSIDASNRKWVKEVEADMALHEQPLIDRLQKIYGDSMPKEKIRVDLGVYGTWAGAYSYSQGIDHIIICTFDGANQGRLGFEIVFHEGSHFLIDKVYKFVSDYFTAKTPQNTRRQTWHIILFYTTGNVVKEIYASRGITFEPYYKHAKFEERIPPFKITTDALALYWDPYIKGETTQQEALQKTLDYILAKEK